MPKTPTVDVDKSCDGWMGRRKTWAGTLEWKDLRGYVDWNSGSSFNGAWYRPCPSADAGHKYIKGQPIRRRFIVGTGHGWTPHGTYPNLELPEEHPADNPP